MLFYICYLNCYCYHNRHPLNCNVIVVIHGQVVPLWLADTSSGRSFPRIAFAGCLETLGSQESALGPKIQLSERSEFCILGPAFRVCLKIAFWQMCVTVCGRFGPNEGRIVGYVT